MTDRELLKQALEYIPDGMKLYDDIRTDIRARLAEDDEEPVGYITYIEDAGILFTQDEPEHGVYEPVYARPQTKARLMDEEINECFEIAQKSFLKHQSGIKGQQLTIQDWPNWHFAKAIEEKIWEKNRDI